ncbi:hypothetical protein IMZ48_49195, partial [Candidatus Bathyarchaeota archaeon]|nr:hypothetical protein [Candidatus Bathyarchaeota archaeon]
MRLAQLAAHSTNAAAAAQDSTSDPWNRSLPDSRDEHALLAAFVDDLAQRSTAPSKLPSPSKRAWGAPRQLPPSTTMKSLDDIDLVPAKWSKPSPLRNDASVKRKASEPPPGRLMTTQTVLQDLVNNLDRPLTEEMFSEYAAFISADKVKDPAAQLSKLLIAEDHRFWQPREAILNSACRNGYKRGKLEHWLSILKAPTSDAMVELFLSRGSLHPPALLNLILRPSAVFTERSTFVSLLKYIATWYAEKRPLSSASEPEPFRITIRRLASHCCRSWPDLLPVVARLAATHIQSGIASTFPQNEVYARRTTTYNYYIQLFAVVPDRRALRYMDFVWEAQRVLLAMSSELQEPLILERKSFTAIRLVLLGLRKTDSERDAAQRWGRSWPPYKIVRDGLDEQKDPEDEYTRPIQAGITMQESGYAREPIDDVIDTLAGTAPDGTPTIQYRAHLLGLIKHGHKVGGEEIWATKVRATR